MLTTAGVWKAHEGAINQIIYDPTDGAVFACGDDNNFSVWLPDRDDEGVYRCSLRQ